MYQPGSAKMLFEEALRMGLSPKWLTDYGLFSVLLNRKYFYIYNSYSNFNSQLSAQLSKNKHNTRVIIEQNNLPNIPYLVTENKKEVEEFLKLHKVIVAKPVLGEQSKKIRLIKSVKDIINFDLAEYIFEKYIQGEEFRYFVFDGQVLGVYKKTYSRLIEATGPIEIISYPRNSWNKGLVKTSLMLTEIMNLKLAGVDFIIDINKKPYILEVNSAPRLYRIKHPTSGPSIDIARIFLKAIIKKIEDQNHHI